MEKYKYAAICKVMNVTLSYALRQIHMDRTCVYAFSCTNTEHRSRSSVAVPPGIVGSVLSSVPNSPSQPEKQDKDVGNFEERLLVRNDYKISSTLLWRRDRQVANRRKAGWRMEGEPNVSWMAAKEKRRSMRDWFSRFDLFWLCLTPVPTVQTWFNVYNVCFYFVCWKSINQP